LHFGPIWRPSNRWWDGAEVVACFDPIGERAARFAGQFANARAYDRYDDLLTHEGLDGVLNLTPAPLHRDTTSAALDAGLHCFSEKPIASTIEQANELVNRAQQRERLLLCAPAVMATERFKWLRKAFAAGRLRSADAGDRADGGDGSGRAGVPTPAIRPSFTRRGSDRWSTSGFTRCTR
jgi:predicted dehydrogenase